MGAKRSRRRQSISKHPAKTHGGAKSPTRPTKRRGFLQGPGAIAKRLAAQRAESRLKSLIRSNKARAKASRDAFRPTKKDRGKLILVTSAVQGKGGGWKGGGGRAASKGRKGFLVYVTKTGKKRLIRESGKHGTPQELKPRRLTDIEVPIRRNLKRAAAKFITARKQVIANRTLGKPKSQLKTKIPANTGGHDFSEKTIKRIARDIAKALRSTVSHRSYIISVIALVRFPNGTSDTIEFSVPIARQDHQAIQLGGIENFVRFKFYAFLAKALQFKGYISTGSANHIRNQLDLQSVQQVGQDEWERYHGESGHTVNSWDAPRFQICRLETIEYKIERIQT